MIPNRRDCNVSTLAKNSEFAGGAKMNELFKNKYRIPSNRLKGWDYSSAGLYFVTICTQNRKSFFGTVENSIMKLSSIGRIAFEFWQKISQLQSHVELDEFVIMPNHLHGVLVLNEMSSSVETLHCNVSTTDVSKQMSKISPKKGSLGSIMRSYKSAVSKWANDNGFEEFKWQARYYDQIVRDEKSLDTIRYYIVHNPMQWHLDKHNPLNVSEKDET
ncbi:MAG: hypothetical protein JEZ06_11785 [Anaerolineaceae bacterium]|nr:hypothetical protein [Anaerolineaceae bacterium]